MFLSFIGRTPKRVEGQRNRLLGLGGGRTIENEQAVWVLSFNRMANECIDDPCVGPQLVQVVLVHRTHYRINGINRFFAGFLAPWIGI
jgi:hypothetical protein